MDSKYLCKKFLVRIRGVVLFVAVVLAVSACQSTGRKKGAKLTSPIPSSVEGVSIPNTHLVARQRGEIYRGMVPYTAEQVHELKKIGIEHVLIFRNDNPNETGTKDELELLKNAQFDLNKVHVIPFRWKEIAGFDEPCRQTLKALRIIKSTTLDSNEKLYFHCTVGEDRTGYLAGIYRMIFESKSRESVYQNEMCARGYAEGDPQKPTMVSRLVHENVSRLFLKMSYLVEKKRITAMNLSDESCNISQNETHEIDEFVNGRLKELSCRPFYEYKLTGEFGH